MSNDAHTSPRFRQDFGAFGNDDVYLLLAFQWGTRFQAYNVD
jgi:hypothetical protein